MVTSVIICRLEVYIGSRSGLVSNQKKGNNRVPYECMFDPTPANLEVAQAAVPMVLTQ